MKTHGRGALLDLWRAPEGAGDPIGCLATTYTFAPGLFDEQCLGRFLDIGSEPSREDLAFLLERENRLGSAYAGVLVDHTQAGVEHSLRWDVLPVRIPAGKQHAKLSLLAWMHRIRVIVASANLTEPGYRYNHEVAAAVDLRPDEADVEVLADSIWFLRALLSVVPGAAARPPDVQRARAFLDDVEQQARTWTPGRRGGTVRQRLAFTLPTLEGRPARSSLEGSVQECRRRGASPNEAWIASPFFDDDEGAGRVAASLCKLMARGGARTLYFCVPTVRSGDTTTVARLAAPVTLLRVPSRYGGAVTVEMLPDEDEDKNRRPWHAKMLALLAEPYSALMVGSSNFTCAGMGVGPHRNAEANLLTIVDRVHYGREEGELEAVWPAMDTVAEPETAEWLGTPEDDEEGSGAPPLPAGFLSAIYRAGDTRQIVLRLDESHLPPDWRIHACGSEEQEILATSRWQERGRVPLVPINWSPTQPPDRLLVRWGEHEAFLPLNVEDSRDLPPPPQLERMSADEMLSILAAADPSAAFRSWARRQEPDSTDPDLDSATPIDLDPLRRYDLHATFLHRIRNRARILAQLRANLQRPVAGHQALAWRLRGVIGVEQLAHRLVQECETADGRADEALLILADLLIVLHEVDYQPSEEALPKGAFDRAFRMFLRELADKLKGRIDGHRDRVSEETLRFWGRVLERCAK